MIAALIGYESFSRLLNPVHISFDQALPIAGLGLCVNLLSAWLLRDDHDHGPDRSLVGHDNNARSDDRGHKHDLNMRAAYVHVMADAAVSVLAIIGLLAGRELGWRWMDAVMGIVGAGVIANWSWGLLRAAGSILLDASSSDSLATTIKQHLEVGADRVADLHLWRLGPGHNAMIATLVTGEPLPASAYKARLSEIEGLSHITIEVEACPESHSG
jgi:cation diffusion facilitator family transporter